MEALGFSGEDQDSIFRILASILHLGNVYFEKYEVREWRSLLCGPDTLGTPTSFQWPRKLLCLPFRLHHTQVAGSFPPTWGCSCFAF